MSKKSECVKVIVRCRPMSEKEIASGFKRVIDMDIGRGVVAISNPKRRSEDAPREFTFDSVYDWNSKQRDLYDESFSPIVEAVLEGYNGTVFAYGQTGTGKTFTMEGIRNDPVDQGVIPNSFQHIFTHISRSVNKKFLVRSSYLEIYQEEIRDLLSKDHTKKLELKERPDTGVYVKDLSAFVAKSCKEIEHVMNVGNLNRKVGRTDMNEHSSRSHAVFVITVECAEAGLDGNDHIRVGKLNLVDLAGSERQCKTGSTGERFKEATKINLSLSALGNVISSLVDGKSTHVPYRDSKLTRLLQDSLGGNAKTCMVTTIGPADYNYEESLTTLRYANRAKNIKNKPKINEDPQDALLREYQDELKRLKQALEKRKTKGGSKQRRKKTSGEGEGGSDEDSSAVISLREEEAKLEKEKADILKNQELVQEEKDLLLKTSQDRMEELHRKRKKQEAIASKIKAMESKLLAGGQNIFDKTNEQEKELEKRRKAMIEQKRCERLMQQELMNKEETMVEIKESFSTIQDEVEHKTKKLNKLHSKLKSVKAEISDQKLEQVQARDNLMLTFTELQKELKLLMLIADNFIPRDVVVKLSSRAVFDEEEEEWTLRPMERMNKDSEPEFKRPVSALGNIRPIATHSVLAAQTGNPRYMAENILQLELDMPIRTTHDYEGPGMAPLVQAVLDAALQEEEEITIDATCIEEMTGGVTVPRSHHRKKVKRKKASSDAKSKKEESFPVSRGLVQSSVRFA